MFTVEGRGEMSQVTGESNLPGSIIYCYCAIGDTRRIPVGSVTVLCDEEAEGLAESLHFLGNR